MTTILYHHFPVQLSEVRRFNFDMGHVIFLPTNEGWGAVPITVAGAGKPVWCSWCFLKPWLRRPLPPALLRQLDDQLGWLSAILLRAAWGVWSFCIEKRHQLWAVFGDVLKRWILYGLIGYRGEPLQSVSLESLAVDFCLQVPYFC